MFNGVIVGTATANADGIFVIIPDKPLPSVPGALSNEAKSNDVVIVSADSVAVDVKAGAATTPIVEAQKPALPPSKTVNLDTVDYDQTGNIVFGGRGPSGSKVQIYIDNTANGLAKILSDGTWSQPGPTSLTVGPHALRAD